MSRGIYGVLENIDRAAQRVANRYWTSDLAKGQHVKSQVFKALLRIEEPKRRWDAINRIGWLWHNKWGTPQ
jgi:hypothetical protein